MKHHLLYLLYGFIAFLVFPIIHTLVRNRKDGASEEDYMAAGFPMVVADKYLMNQSIANRFKIYLTLYILVAVISSVLPKAHYFVFIPALAYLAFLTIGGTISYISCAIRALSTQTNTRRGFKPGVNASLVSSLYSGTLCSLFIYGMRIFQ